MKKPFERFAADNLAWTVAFIAARIKDRKLAEDYAQEVMIKAFRAYDGFDGEGERAWLNVIARNFISDRRKRYELSLDDMLEDGASLRDKSEPEPETAYESRELLGEIFAAVSRMSMRDEELFRLRFLFDLSEAETALRLELPLGTVKSRTSFIRAKLRTQFKGQQKPLPKPIEKGKFNMDCNEFRGLLLPFSRGITASDEIAAHIKACPECAALADSFRLLAGKIPFKTDAERTHVLIIVPFEGGEYDWSFSRQAMTEEQSRAEIEKSEEIKTGISRGELEYISLPREKEVGGFMVSRCSSFDESALPIKFVRLKNGYRLVYERAPTQFGGYDYGINGMFCKPERDYIRQKEGEDGVFECRLENNFGSAVYSSLYFAVPRGAKVKMVRGSGVYDCGAYKFAYSSRYVAEGERITLEFEYSE